MKDFSELLKGNQELFAGLATDGDADRIGFSDSKRALCRFASFNIVVDAISDQV
ncbi:MAG: hypothetical protein R2852_01915 [Bacteroidia bacterium]